MKKYNEWKKTFAFTFALAIAGNSMPVFAGTSVYAEEAVEEPTETSSETEVLIDSGTCGELASYELDANGKVTGKFAFETNVSSQFRPVVASGAAGLAAVSTRNLVILQ